MKKENVALEKSYAFALRIINLYRFLTKKHEYLLSKQILKSGTSIGANVEEANGCFTKKDFKSKMSISYKEARETLYWLRLLSDSRILTTDQAEPLILDCEELLRIIGSAIKTIKAQESNNS